MSCDSLIFCAATVFPAVIKTRRMGRLLYLLYAELPKVICHSEHRFCYLAVDWTGAGSLLCWYFCNGRGQGFPGALTTFI